MADNIEDMWGPDPRFPDRPDHPDLRRLAAVVNELDTRSDVGQDFDTILHDIIDTESLFYISRGRTMRLASNPVLLGLLQSVYADAFAMGVRFQQAGGHREKQ